MQVKLISYTQDALELLLRTKNTRLANDDDPSTWSDEKKQDHLDYMRDTIKSSWEFVDYVFEITGVSRAFTHQFVRTRTGSYAQESQRTVDPTSNGWLVPRYINDSATPDQKMMYNQRMMSSFISYDELLSKGIPHQDARNVLPTGVLTSITAKFNLRTLHQSAELRLCTRTQGEYQDVFKAMQKAVIEVHPWAEDFLNVYCVNHCTCAFPRYGESECPVYPHVIGRHILNDFRKEIKIAFESTVYEATPKADGGKSM